jgi:hypothetical protein
MLTMRRNVGRNVWRQTAVVRGLCEGAGTEAQSASMYVRLQLLAHWSTLHAALQSGRKAALIRASIVASGWRL